MFASQSYCEVQMENICKPLGFPLQCCIKGKAHTQYLNESLNECMRTYVKPFYSSWHLMNIQSVLAANMS